MTARVIKAVAGEFCVAAEGRLLTVRGRGKCKRQDKIIVGDLVRVDNGVIEEVLPRTNRLVRPEIANVDRILVVLASLPEPDLSLCDKLIIYADSFSIPVTVILNKSDLHEKVWREELTAQYSGVARVMTVSALTGENLEDLRAVASHGVSVLAGQSAVGKSSLVNALGGKPLMETGEVGERSGRGRHTTRHAELFGCNDGLIADTPGFSMLDGADLTLKYEDADYYYTDLFAYSHACRYNRCTHTHEPDCAVKAAVGSGELSKARYERYLKLRQELKEQKPY